MNNTNVSPSITIEKVAYITTHTEELQSILDDNQIAYQAKTDSCDELELWVSADENTLNQLETLGYVNEAEKKVLTSTSVDYILIN